MKNATIGKVIKGVSVLLDVAVPLIATMTQFPIWIEASSEATMSGLFLCLAILCALPFLKQIREYMKSPSMIVMWFGLFILFVILNNIIKQMIIVCFAGMIANIIGAGIYKLGEFIEKRPNKCKGGVDNGKAG